MTVALDQPPTVVALREQLADQDRTLRKMRAEIDALTRHDALTNVLNRRTLLEMLDAELVRSHRTGHPFCFAMVDIDGFVGINEKHGHPTGDTILKTVAYASVKLLRALDRFGRLGGDEFGILLPATWLDSGVIAMNRLRAAIGAVEWSAVTPRPSVTFSAGLTTNAPGDNVERILQRAERGLLQAKTGGGDRTVLIEDAMPGVPLPDA